MIGVTICFPCRSNIPKDAYSRETNKSIKKIICSIYHPVEHDEQRLFNDELDTFYTNAPQNSEIIAGQDINANVGISSPMFNYVLGPNGIRNRNAKGKYLLFLIKSQKLKVLLSYFTHNCYITWKSFAIGNSPHMLNNFICSESFFKRVRDCKVKNIGVRSDHSAVIVSFRITAIKFKVKEKIKKIIDWKKINGMLKLTLNLILD